MAAMAHESRGGWVPVAAGVGETAGAATQDGDGATATRHVIGKRHHVRRPGCTWTSS